jgi:HlyD family secretion protein
MSDELFRSSGMEPSSDVAQLLQTESSHRSRRKRRWYLAGIVVAVAGVGAGLLIASNRHNHGVFKTEEARRGNLVVTVAATGNLEPTNQVQVGVEVSGTIEAVEVDYNDSLSPLGSPERRISRY